MSGSGDKTLSIWDMRTGLTVQTFYGHLNAVNDANFSISGHLIASCDSDGILKVWDIRMVQELLQLDTGDAIAHQVCFDKTSKLAVVALGDGNAKFVNVDKGEIATTVHMHDDSVNGLIINQDNSAIYTIGSDGNLKSWR